MCFRIDAEHILCGHTDIIIQPCNHHNLCGSTDYPTSNGFRFPIHVIAVIPIQDLSSRFRECEINHTLLNDPDPRDSEVFKALVEDVEIEDRYWRENESTVHNRDTASQPQDSPANIVSSRVRRWREEGLPLEEFEDYDEENDRGVVSVFIDAINGISPNAAFGIEDPLEERLTPTEYQFEDDIRYQVPLTAFLNEFPIDEWRQDAIARDHVENFVNELPVVDIMSLPEEDRRCGICFQAYLRNEEDGHLQVGEQAVRIPCQAGHCYGIDCLRAWFVPSRNPRLSCPACREDILVANGERIGQRIR